MRTIFAAPGTANTYMYVAMLRKSTDATMEGHD
jgi:hypothetical protein